MFLFCSSLSSRGVSRSSRTLGWNAVDAEGLTDDRLCFRGRKKSCGPGAPMLGAKPRCKLQRLREATVANSWFTEESTKDTVKPLRREGRRDAAYTCCRRALAQSFLRGGRGCLAGTRSSLRPRCFRGHIFRHHPGAIAPRECGGVSE